MQVKVKKLVPEAVIPKYATDGSGAFDLVAVSKHKVANNVYQYGTGLAFEIPKGYGMFVLSRSGHGFKHQVSLSNSVGLIDSDYRGEVQVQLIANMISSNPILSFFEKLRNKLFGFGSRIVGHSAMDELNVGDKIAQAVILPLDKVRFRVVDTLSDTKRGTGGFGSTDKKKGVQ